MEEIGHEIGQAQIPTSVWSMRRKFFYLATFVVIIILLSIYPLYKIFYTVPACFDNKQNQEELGVDCGGPCSILCEQQVSPVNIIWGTFFQVQKNLFDIAALIENQNTNAGIEHLDYTLRVYDERDELIEERNGTSFLNPNEQALLFEPNIGVLGQTPTRVEVDLGRPTWVSAERFKTDLAIKNKVLSDIETSPRLTVTIENNEDRPVQDIEARALIYDSRRNIVAISSTHIESLERNEARDIFFTWPTPISGAPYERACTAPVDAVLIFDRSGSMNDDSPEPPQPITAAKAAAQVFVNNMGDEDYMSLVSFATGANVDQTLTSDHSEVESAIENITIGVPDNTQHTNIGDAILKAIEELRSERTREIAKKAIVVLTDGIASRPLPPEGFSNESGLSYAEVFAGESAEGAHESKMLVYAIGLGANVNEEFLSGSIATTPEHYYGAATAGDLERIYGEIAESVCLDEVFITEILVRTNNFNILQ